MSLTAYDDKPAEARVSIRLHDRKIDIQHRISPKDALWYITNCIIPTFGSYVQYKMLTYAQALFLFATIFLLLPFYKVCNAALAILVLKFAMLVIVFSVFLPIGLGFVLGLSPKFRGKVFPKIGYAVHKMYEPTTKLIVTPQSIVDKKFVVPDFKNAFISYNLYGEFKEALERIDIVENNMHVLQIRNSWRCFHWKATFSFSKLPKDGFMEVSYL
jgi:hypothetical protein